MATPDAAGTPILEAVHVRPSALVALPPSRSAPRFSHSSSSRSSQSSRSNSSVGGGSARRLAVAAGRRAPSLRRSQAQDSDPCMLGSSFDDWSDGDEEEKQEESTTTSALSTPSRPGVQRSHTEKKPAGMGGGLPPPLLAPAKGSAPSPVAPLTIRVRKFASTSALDPPSTSFASATPDAISSAPSPSDPSPLSTDTPTRDAVSAALASALEEGRPLERDDELLRASRFDKDELGTARRRGSLPVDTSTRTVGSTAPQPPPAPPPRWFLAWTQNARFRRWYGRILNSYFAFWLVVCSLVVAVLEMVLLLTLVVMRHNKTDPHNREEKQAQCHTLTRGSLGPVHYIGAAACVVLALPVLVPVEWLSLYRKRADRRMVRRPYLHLCELFVNAEIGYLLYFFLAHAYRLPLTMECHRELAFSELTFLYATLLLWGVLWWQLVVFCRFLVHLKLQADAANDAIHTSAVSEWLRPPVSEHARASTSIHRFKKLLYRAAVRGDLDTVNELVDDASLARYGISDGARGLRALYDTGPTLWLFAFASSCKNPLHIAAKRGHTAVVRRLLALGLNANALDKVARVNFNIGLLFKLSTRLLLKTQDGSKSPIRAVLCSVLLPPLHGAVAAGHVDVVRLLLEEGGANPNALPRASFYYPSAVIPAIFLADDPEIVKLLVASGANFLHVATTTLSGLASSTYATPLQRSALTQRSATTEYLLASGGDVALTPLHAAAAADNVRTVRRLLRRRSPGSNATSTSVDARGERVEGVQRRTPLHWAAVVGRAAATKELLERGADPNARDRYGRTPLHWAARNNHAPVVLLLLAHGADATAEDDGGVPVLSFAAEAEGVAARVVSALLEYGASLKHQLPASGDTALHVALQRENRETAKSLIRCGADLMASNRDGKRAVDVTSSTRLQFELKKEAGTRDVMISYPHSHFAFAQRVREYLETHAKLTCWMDTMDPSGIGGGAVWREEIARGIHNCSLVVSVVCGGYTTSEWCLKELALAKMIRKPVVALLVEPPAPTPIREDDSDRRAVAAEPLPVSPLDALVPPERRLPFHDFVRGTRVLDKRVELDVDEAALEAAWRAVLPQLRNAMQASSEQASTGRWLKSQSTASSSQGLSTRGGEDSSRAAGRPGLRVVGRRLVSQTDSEPEQEDESETNDSRDGDRDASDDERKTETDEPTAAMRRARERASPPPSTSSLDVADAETDAPLSIAVYSTVEPSALSTRLVRDLSREDFRARALTIPTRGEKDEDINADSDAALAPLVDKLRTFGALVVVVESLGAERSARDQRQAASAQLARLMRAAATARVAVFPIAARDEFLSFSNLYTLARSELLYFVSGAGEAQATAALLQQLRRSADARRGPE